MDGVNMQKHQISKDKPEVQGADPFAFADTGSGQMTFDVQHGKQFLDPQFQVGSKIFQSRFDLSLKESELSVMQSKAPILWFLLINSHC